MMSNDHIFYSLRGIFTTLTWIEFRSFQGAYQICSASVNDANSCLGTTWVTLGDKMYFVESDWQAVGAANLHWAIKRYPWS